MKLADSFNDLNEGLVLIVGVRKRRLLISKDVSLDNSGKARLYMC